MNFARSRAAAVLLDNGQVLVAGGDTPSGRTAAAETYDPSSGVWTTVHPMLVPRTWFTLTKLANGNVLAAGGATGGTNAGINSAEIYYPAENTWRAVANMFVARARATAQLLPNGRVLVAGGTSDGSTPLSTSEVFDPSTSAWSTLASFGGARYDAASTVLGNGSVLLAGGYGGAAGLVTLASTFSIDDNLWHPVGTMPSGRTEFGLTTLSSTGKVLASGGNAAGRPTSTMLFDPSSNTWSGGAPTNSPHDEGTATALTGGTVLEAGGQDAVGPSSVAEVYDPVANLWQTSTMGTSRFLHTATQLPNGQVLVAGGYLTTQLSSAEIFTPTTSVITDPALTFADTATGGGSNAAIQVTNTGNSILLAGDFSLSGANPGDFSLSVNGCYGVAPGGTCLLGVHFAPGDAGLRTATLKFSANTVAGAHAVSLTGRGVTPVPPGGLGGGAFPPAKIDVKLSYGFKTSRTATWFQKLQVKGVPSGSTITVTCAKGCAKKKYIKRKAKGTVSILPIVGKKHIAVGRVITVVVGHSGQIAAVKTIKIRKKDEPLVTTRCLPPGAKKSVSCAAV